MSKPLVAVCLALAALGGWGCASHSARPSTPVAAIAAATVTAPPATPSLAEEAEEADAAELERRDNEWALAQARANGCVAIPR